MPAVLFKKNQISEVIDELKDIWKELGHLGLIPKPKEALHGFSPNELISHFAGVSVSPLEETVDVDYILENVSQGIFKFKPVTSNDVILAISHFSSQAKGEDEIPQSVIVKALSFIGNFLVKIINTFLEQGVFPSAWKKAQLIVLKKVSAPSSPSDFRPIALLSFLSKVLGKKNA